MILFRRCQPRPPFPPQQRPPTGAKAEWATLATLLLLVIIRLLIAWAEGRAASLRQRTETTDLMRTFGTTDTALILERLTVGLQRLRALEAEVLRGPPNVATDPQRKPMGAASSPRTPSAFQPPGLTPEDIHLLPALTPEPRTAAPVRATGPPCTPSQSEKAPTGPNHPLTPRGMAGPVVPIPRPHGSRAAG
jgi:hypothetical protein